jgi:uncharacterized protein YidB (DUF937 family)
MRLIHEVIDSIQEWHDEETTPLGAALTEVLGGERGSLPDLADRFAKAGFTPILESWIGDGPIQPIEPRELRVVLGNERVGDLATLTGLPSDQFLAIFARVLPSTVHRMTRHPEVEAPEAVQRTRPRRGASDAA